MTLVVCICLAATIVYLFKESIELFTSPPIRNAQKNSVLYAYLPKSSVRLTWRLKNLFFDKLVLLLHPKGCNFMSF